MKLQSPNTDQSFLHIGSPLVLLESKVLPTVDASESISVSNGQLGYLNEPMTSSGIRIPYAGTYTLEVSYDDVAREDVKDKAHVLS